MKSVSAVEFETCIREAVAPVFSRADALDDWCTQDDSEWHSFRERLLDNLHTNEWSGSRPPQIVAGIVEMAQRTLAACTCTLLLTNGHGHRVYHSKSGGSDSREMVQGRVDRLTGPAAWVVTHKSPLALNTVIDWAVLGEAQPEGQTRTDQRLLCVPLVAGVRVLGAMELTRHNDDEPFTERDVDSAQVMGATAGIAIENARLRQSVEDSYRNTIRALASAIDAKDPYTCGHSQSVAQYSLICGRVLNLDGDKMQTLETAALLHDIGKIGIDDAILRKPRKLSPAERAVVKDHPVIGAAIVHNIGSMDEVVSYILHHHESYDGSGYPHGLKGEDIPFGARIIAVADSFDSMTTDRPYRRGMTINEAMTELLRCRGTQFCPVALDAFAVGFTRYYDDLPRRPCVMEQPDRIPVAIG